ncbi:arginine kinase-like [Cylas formicarius]|uniref:arginine kinase-like n=1 Tax=Cylas formicarius TaxID=197179 RepID=UPI0029588E5F|nr:arginine kinase-like [Cylas formicarius]
MSLSKSKCTRCEESCGKGKASVDVIRKLEAAFDKLASSNSTSLLKRYLTRTIFDDLKTRKTSFGSTLLDCIQSGLENFDSSIGVYAADPECYSLFAELFDPIIEAYHGFKKSDRQPPTAWGPVDTFANLDPKDEYIVSTRIRCCRTVKGYPFNPCMAADHYREIERQIVSVLNELSGEYRGIYHPLTGMPKDVQQNLIDSHYLFKEGDRFLQSANACRHWPTGRGIFFNDKKTFLVWVCEEDHLRIMCMQPGGNVGEVYRRLVGAVTELEKKLTFIRSDRFGYVTFCPTNLGTTIRASVHIKLPKLASNMDKLKNLAEKYHLQVRGTAGEHTESEGGVYDLSNKRRLGLTEHEVMKEMYTGISEILKHEKSAK